jgi:NADPH:quinone reductase-like Zn-dependent oxidoreductase
MKAIICKKYGSPEGLKFKEVEKPIPKNNEILVKVFATAVTAGDVKIRSMKIAPLFWVIASLLRIKKPKKKILGTVIAGEIEAVGDEITHFRIGDQVMGSTSRTGFGGYAQYVCMPENVVAKKPINMTYEEATTIPVGATTALFYIRKAGIQNGFKGLIFGASGSVGTFAVQLAKLYGTKITGVCSTTNLELVKGLGVDKVIDYRKEDFTKSGEKYDFIFDAVGKISPSMCRKLLNSNGKYITVNSGIAWTTAKDLDYLRDLIEAGKIKTVIDKRYSLENIVEAHRYVDMGHKKGNVIITIEHNNNSIIGG